MNEMVVTVRGIAIEKKSRLPILFLGERESGRTLTIPIGPAEANSIILHMEGILPPRPLTHDLLAELFQRHGFRLRSLELYGYCGDEILARLRYSHGIRMHTMEVRPSDGIALAVRLLAPILVNEEVASHPAGAQAFPWADGFETSDFLYLEPAAPNLATAR